MKAIGVLYPAKRGGKCGRISRNGITYGLWCKLAGRANAPCCAAQTSSPKHRVPDCRRSSAVNAQTSQSELSLADAMHQLDAGDRDRRIPEPLEAEHHRDALLHAPMVLLNQVVQVLRRAQLRVRGQRAIGFQTASPAAMAPKPRYFQRLFFSVVPRGGSASGCPFLGSSVAIGIVRPPLWPRPTLSVIPHRDCQKTSKPSMAPFMNQPVSLKCIRYWDDPVISVCTHSNKNPAAWDTI